MVRSSSKICLVVFVVSFLKMVVRLRII